MHTHTCTLTHTHTITDTHTHTHKYTLTHTHTHTHTQRISREEFHRGCALLNGNLSADSDQRLTDIDHTLDLMDFDGSNDLDINEFFEVRIKFQYLI